MINGIKDYKILLERVIPHTDLKKYHDGLLEEIALVQEALVAISKDDRKISAAIAENIEKSILEGTEELNKLNKLFH